MEQIPEPKKIENTAQVDVDAGVVIEVNATGDKTLIVNDSGTLPIVALISSILGLVCCGSLLFSILGLVLGKMCLNQISNGRLNPRHEGLARAAYMLGIVGSVLAALCLAFYLVYMTVILLNL